MVTQRLDWSANDIHINFSDPSSQVQIMPTKLRALRDGKPYKIELFSNNTRLYDVKKRVDALSFMATNIKEGWVLTC